MKRLLYIIGVLLLGLLLIGGETAAAQPQSQPVVIPHIEGTVELDGLSIEPGWQAIEPLPLVMFMPENGAAPTERTEVRLAHNDDFLYVSGRLFRSDPSMIQSASKKRDEVNVTSEFFGIMLDTYNDNENSLGFFTMPSGLRTDIAFSNDSEGEMQEFFNANWNTFWDVATVVDDRGWFVEMRIPFSSLRFQDVNGRVTMGLIVWNWIASKREAHTYPAIPDKWGWWSMTKSSQAQDVVLEGVRSRRPLYVAPYVLGGMGQTYALNMNETAYLRADDPTFDVGLDLKYGLTSNLTLDLTLNTDFAQVEADNRQVNLTRFSLFFPEKRKFFQERASVFDFGDDTESRLFYSRRIGLYEGRAVPILGGARVVGRVGEWDVGVLDMQTARTGFGGSLGTLPSENFGVLRLKRRVLNPYSYVGAMTTSRVGMDGDYNLAYGLDGTIRVVGNEYLTFSGAQTLQNNYSAGLDATYLQAKWARRKLIGIGYDASFIRSGAAYEPAVGFELRDDYTRLRGMLNYGHLGAAESDLLRREIRGSNTVFLRGEDGSIESVRAAAGWINTYKSGTATAFRGTVFHEDLREEFLLSDEANIPAGSYTFYQVDARYAMPDSRLLNTIVYGKAGAFYDGYIASFSVTPAWSLSSDLKLSGYYEFNFVRFPERETDFITHLGRIRLRTTLTTRFSASAFLQYGSLFDVVSANIRFRYNPRQGNDFYLVYNELINTNRNGFDPVLPFSGGRTILAKYTYTFAF